MTDSNAAQDRDHDREAKEDAEHLEELPDGSGCTEIWEHLSERRNEGERDREET